MTELTAPAPPADGPTGRPRKQQGRVPGTGTPTRAALTLAVSAASISVTRRGAMASYPSLAEVQKTLQ